MLLPNDGDLAHALSHPGKEVAKTYLVKVRGRFTTAMAEQMRGGLLLEDGMTLPAQVKNIRAVANNCWFEVTLREGRNRQVRRMCEFFGLTVVRLKRIKLGFLTLDGVRTGTYRQLLDTEVAKLKRKC